VIDLVLKYIFVPAREKALASTKIFPHLRLKKNWEQKLSLSINKVKNYEFLTSGLIVIIMAPTIANNNIIDVIISHKK
jgi:hypothetical protein